MSLAKRAQHFDDNFFANDKTDDFDPISEVEDLLSQINVGEDAEEEDEHGDIDIDEPEYDVAGEVTLQVGEDNPEEFVFILPQLPGSDDVDEPEESNSELDVEEDEDEVENEPRDVWNYGKLQNFLPWLAKMFQNVPRHNRELSGLERAVAYLQMLDKSISRAVRSDIRDELDIAKIEKARKEICDGMERLEEAIEKMQSKNKKKKASQDPEYRGQLIKEAQKITGVKGIMITVPLIISRAARVCINGMVSGGHDIEDMFDRQVKKYSFDVVQQGELMQLLEDMGYTLRRDRGFLRDEDIDTTRSDNFDWAANYHG